MKKQILTISIAAIMATTNAFANTEDKGFKNLKDLGSTVGDAGDEVFRKLGSTLSYIYELPGKTKDWSGEQVESLRENICDEPKEIIKIVEVEVDKIVYRDKIVKVEVPVYIQPKQRRCSIKTETSRFGDVTETRSCSEWRQGSAGI